MDAIVQTTRRYCQGRQVGAEYDNGCENFQAYPVFRGAHNEVLMMTDLDSANSIANGDYYYGHDQLFSPVALYDASGNVVERYEYDAYGKCHFMAANFSSRTQSLYANPYTFTGRELDSLDNNTLHLMYYRARTYDPQTGRFMQRDPLDYVDGMILYLYAINNPIMWNDPLGLAKTKVTEYNPEKAKQQTTSWSYVSASFWNADKCCCFAIAEFINQDIILDQAVLPLGFEPDGILTKILNATNSPLGSIATKLFRIGLGKQLASAITLTGVEVLWNGWGTEHMIQFGSTPSNGRKCETIPLKEYKLIEDYIWDDPTIKWEEAGKGSYFLGSLLLDPDRAARRAAEKMADVLFKIAANSATRVSTSPFFEHL